jgi:phosphoglycolate phosphatase
MAPGRRIKAVLFDWDGVLLDSLRANYQAYTLIFERFGLKPMTLEEFRRHTTPNWYLFYEKLGIPRERWREADHLWEESYYKVEVPTHPDAKPALTRLKELGLILLLVTNGEKRRVLRELDNTGLAGFFDHLVFSEDVGAMKPDPRPILAALALARVDASEALYVGDCPDDARASRAAGVRMVAVSNGLCSEAALKKAGVDQIYPNLQTLVDRLFPATGKGRYSDT